MSEPLVSIVLPTYNRAHLLGHAIRSVLAQTHRNLELIVVDDNSKDETPSVVRSFDDARIRYVRNDPNLKLPAALNRVGDAMPERMEIDTLVHLDTDLAHIVVPEARWHA